MFGRLAMEFANDRAGTRVQRTAGVAAHAPGHHVVTCAHVLGRFGFQAPFPTCRAGQAALNVISPQQ